MAEATEACGVKFIGPPPSVLRLIGDKAQARQEMKKAGLPVLPGTEEPPESLALVMKAARKLGYPLILKATAGGGDPMHEKHGQRHAHRRQPAEPDPAQRADSREDAGVRRSGDRRGRSGRRRR